MQALFCKYGAIACFTYALELFRSAQWLGVVEHTSTYLVKIKLKIQKGASLILPRTLNFDFDTHFILINVTILTIVLSERRTTIYFLLSRSAGMNVHTHSATQAKKAYMLNGRNWAKPGRAVCKRIARLQLNPAIAGPIARAREAALWPTPFTVARWPGGAELLHMMALDVKAVTPAAFFIVIKTIMIGQNTPEGTW